MKRTAALVATLVLLFLGSPLLALEDLASPSAEGLTAESVALSFLNPATQPVSQCATPALFPDLGMTARECAQTCGGCCACASYDGSRCRDWQCC